MESSLRKERKEWIDIAKGIGIWFVVLGHCFVKDTYIHNWIFSFHMPFFFLLSGYCFNPDKYQRPVEVIKARFRALMIPYFVFVVVGVIVSLIIPQWRTQFEFGQVLKDIYQGYPSLSHITSIWYLLSLFIITVVYYIAYYITTKINKKLILYIFIALSGFFGYLITIVKKILDKLSTGKAATGKSGFKMPGDRLPLTIDASMTALVFFALGTIVLYIFVEKRKHKISDFVILILINVIFGSILNTRVNIHGCTYGNVLFFYIAAITGSMAFFSLSIWLQGKQGKVVKILKSVFAFYGKNSLFMFAMQSLLINLYFLVVNIATGNEYVIFETLPTHLAIIGFFVIIILLPVIFYLYRKIKHLFVPN